MRLLTLEECARRLDPEEAAGIKARTLRGKIPTVRVGKRDLVPETVFDAYCQGLEEQCRAKMPNRALPSVQKMEPASSAGTTKAPSESVARAQATIAKLTKRSRPSRRTDP